MLRIVFVILFSFSVVTPVKAGYLDGYQTYTIVTIGLALKNTLSHYSKKLSPGKELDTFFLNRREILSITLRCFADAAGLFLIKEAGDTALQQFGEVAPEWLRPKKITKLESEINRLKAQLQEKNQTALAIDSALQTKRINELKQDLLKSHLEKALKEVDELLTCRFQFMCLDNSLPITNLLIEIAQKALDLYQGYSTKESSSWAPNHALKTTGETGIYNQTEIEILSDKFMFKSRLPSIVKELLTDRLETFCKKKQQAQAEYIRHFLEVLGIEISIPNTCSNEDTRTKTDL